MKKIPEYLWSQFKYFLINPFWQAKVVWFLICPAVLINGFIWYLYIKFYKDLIGVVPISYSLAVVVLNVFLANIIYRKQTLVSLSLLSSGILIQIIFLIFLKLFAISQAF
jgi:hypothetical protein